MTQFDALLRQALMDANLAQYERALRNAEAGELEVSPRYLRERTRLLADPRTWERRRTQGGHRARLNWRLIAVAAALLLLSACGYALVTGQFSQWFPRMGVDPKDPEVSEEVLSRTGTAIEQSQTVGNETATLNAAIWDGEYVQLSLVLESPDFPEELTKDSHIYCEECSLKLPEEQLREYLRGDALTQFERRGETPTPEKVEEHIRFYMDLEPPFLYPGFDLRGREGDTLTFDIGMPLNAYVEQPELTLHVENIAIYEYVEEAADRTVRWQDGVRSGPEPEIPVLRGPFDFTFTLEEPILPIRYKGDVEVTAEDIPFRFTGLKTSVFDVDIDFEVLAPVESTRPEEYDELKQQNPDMLYDEDVNKAIHRVIHGLWTEDGGYVDLSQRGGGSGMTTSLEGDCEGDVSVRYPYPIDPAAVTAVDIGGTRVELSELTAVTERAAEK